MNIDHELRDLANALINKVRFRMLKGESVPIQRMPYVFKDLISEDRWDLAAEAMLPIRLSNCVGMGVGNGCENIARFLVGYTIIRDDEEVPMARRYCVSCSVISAANLKHIGFYPTVTSIKTGVTY